MNILILLIENKGALIQMRNRLVEGKDGDEHEKHMGKGKRVKKKKPFLEDDMEQSEVSYSNYFKISPQKISKYHNCIDVHTDIFMYFIFCCQESPSKKNKPAMSSSSSDIIKKYKDLQKVSVLRNTKSDVQ